MISGDAGLPQSPSITSDEKAKAIQIESSSAEDRIMLSTRESKVVADALDKLAESKGQSRSKFISNLIQQALNQNESKAEKILKICTHSENLLQGLTESLPKGFTSVKRSVDPIAVNFSNELATSIDKLIDALRRREQYLAASMDEANNRLWNEIFKWSLVRLPIELFLIMIAIWATIGGSP